MQHSASAHQVNPGLQGEGLELPEEFAAFEIAGRSCKDFKLGVCVCFDEGDKEEETTCLPCPIDLFLKSCVGPLGKCLVGGRCEPDDKDGGCPCDSKLSPFVQCKTIPANNPCIDKEQPCECDGDGDCIIIYLPEVTACGDEFLNGCMVNRCIDDGNSPGVLTCQSSDVDTKKKLCVKEFTGIPARSPGYCEGVGGSCDAYGACVTMDLPPKSPCVDCVYDALDSCINPGHPCACDGFGVCEANYMYGCGE